MQVEEATGGCCGLAGSRGFEEGKHDISMQCGEEGLLPAVRDAATETVIVSNGFSCKTQLQQSGVGHGALHAAQVLKLAREHGTEGCTPGKPEDPYYENGPPAPAALKRTRAATATAAVAAASVAAVSAMRC